MASVSSPITHAQLDGGAIQARYAFILGAIRRRLREMVTLRSMGAVRYAGDVGGTGSDTLRETFYDGIGWDASMASTAETGTTSLSSVTVEVEDIAVGRYSLGFSESYQSRILGRPGEINVDLLAQLIPNSWEATWMDLLATTLAAAAADYGTSGADMTFDDYLDAVFYYRTLDGFMPVVNGKPNLFAMLHGQQLVDLANSVKAEPNYQFPEATDAQLAARGPGYQWDWLGACVHQSNRITSSGGNRHGGFFGGGAIGWINASLSQLRVENPQTALIVPELGLVTEFRGVPADAKMQMYSNTWIGMAIQDDSQVRGMVTDA
jgi:hypothetical protein